jgi:hypothetical protein
MRCRGLSSSGRNHSIGNKNRELKGALETRLHAVADQLICFILLDLTVTRRYETPKDNYMPLNTIIHLMFSVTFLPYVHQQCLMYRIITNHKAVDTLLSTKNKQARFSFPHPPPLREVMSARQSSAFHDRNKARTLDEN